MTAEVNAATTIMPPRVDRGSNVTNGYDDKVWRRCALVFVSVFVACLFAIAVLIVVIDPYDSGRFPSILLPGVSDESPRTANASRVRDPQFNAAIFGNSLIQLVDPSRLDQLTERSFVQLSVPGTGPREQVALLDRFRELHAHIDTVVLGVDDVWCRPDPAMPLSNPFPFWLYRGEGEFLRNHLNSRVIALSWRRILVALGKLPRTDRAGYWDYEAGHSSNFNRVATDLPYVDLSPAASTTQKYPAIDLVVDALSRLPKTTNAIVIMPPRFRDGLPQPDSAGAAHIANCKSYLAARLAERPNSVLLDFFLDTPAGRDPKNFMDQGHYRAPLARMIEQRIAERLPRIVPRAEK